MVTTVELLISILAGHLAVRVWAVNAAMSLFLAAALLPLWKVCRSWVERKVD